MAQTSRWRIPVPDEDDNADGPADMLAIANSLDDHAKILIGNDTSKPSPGRAGTLYLATDFIDYPQGVLYIDTGVAWRVLNILPNLSLGAYPYQLADQSITAPKLATPAVRDVNIYDLSIAERHVADRAITSRKAALTTLSGQASSDQTLAYSATTGADVPGTSVTFTVATSSIILVTATFDFDGRASSNDNNPMHGRVILDGSAQARQAILHRQHLASDVTKEIRGTVSQSYRIALTAGSHTLKLNTYLENTTVNGFYQCLATNTGWTALVVAA